MITVGISMATIASAQQAVSLVFDDHNIMFKFSYFQIHFPQSNGASDEDTQSVYADSDKRNNTRVYDLLSMMTGEKRVKLMSVILCM